MAATVWGWGYADICVHVNVCKVVTNLNLNKLEHKQKRKVVTSLNINNFNLNTNKAIDMLITKQYCNCDIVLYQRVRPLPCPVAPSSQGLLQSIGMNHTGITALDPLERGGHKGIPGEGMGE